MAKVLTILLLLLYSEMGRNFWRTSNYTAAKRYLQMSLDMYGRLYGDNCDQADIADALDILSCCFSDMGDHREAIINHTLSLEMDKRIHGEDSEHPDIAAVLYNIGNNYCNMKEYTKAEEYYRQSLNMYKRIHGEESDHTDIAMVLWGSVIFTLT